MGPPTPTPTPPPSPTTTARVPRELAALPSWLASQTALYGDRLVREQLIAAGARKHHFAVLITLGESGPISQADLGRRLWIDRSDLHAVINELEAAGSVARVRDPDDRRRNLVDLTPGGRRRLKRLSARVAAAQVTLLEPLSPAERETLHGLLTRVVEHHAARRSR